MVTTTQPRRPTTRPVGRPAGEANMTVNLRLAESLTLVVDRLATDERRSRANMIAMLLREALAARGIVQSPSG